MAFLNKGLKIVLIDEESQSEEIYLYEGGIASYVEFLNKNKNETLMLKTRKIHKSKVF